MIKRDVLALVFARNAFYKRMHYLALSALALMLCVIIFLAAVLWYLVRHPIQPLYFSTDSIGRLIPIIPQNIPNMPTNDVAAWAIEAALKTLSYDFINYRDQFQSSEKYFTDFGWTNYMKAITSANNLPAVKQRKMIVAAQISGQPKLVREGILGGAYAWKFEVPMLLVNMLPPYNEKSKYSNPVSVSVLVQRQPILQSNKGLAIVQLVVTSSVNMSNQPQEISGTSTG